MPAFAAHPLASVVAFVACATAAGLLLRAVGAALRRGEGASSRVDRAMGALVGGGKAGVVLWVLLSALALWGRPLHVAGLDVDPAGSELVALAGEHSALRAISHSPHGAERAGERGREPRRRGP